MSPGRSSDSPEPVAFPSLDSGLIDRPLRRAYSSGYCCRFSQHSLFQSGCKGTKNLSICVHPAKKIYAEVGHEDA